MGDADDRTIPATPRRREMARRQGAMPTASQPAWVATAITAIVLFPAWSRATLPAATELMRGGLVTAVVEGSSARARLEPPPLAAVLLPTVAVALAAGVVGIAVRLVGDGGGWRLARALPEFHRISPLAGFTRIFSPATAGAVLANALGLTALVAVAGLSAAGLIDAVAAPEAADDPARLLTAVQRLAGTLTAAAALLAVCQWALARRRFERRIRMTPQEFADEARSMQAASHVRFTQARPAPTAARSASNAGNSATGIRSDEAFR